MRHVLHTRTPSITLAKRCMSCARKPAKRVPSLGDLLAQHAPGHVRAQFFARHCATSFARRAFYRWAMLGRHAARAVKPRPHMPPVTEPARDRQCSLPA